MRKANFNIGVVRAPAAFDRRGTFVVEKSKLGPCAEPDVALGTQGCGATSAPYNAVLLLTGGRLEVTGEAEPYVADGQSTCPFFLVSSRGAFSPLDQSDPLDHDATSGLLGTRTRVGGAQFFKRRTVVLRGGRTQAYRPTAPPQLGFAGQSKIAWTLTLRPRKG